MKVNKFNQILDELKIALNNIKYEGDLSDIGNEIGLVIGNHIGKNELGYNIDSFISGLKHGVSLIDGTHE